MQYDACVKPGDGAANWINYCSHQHDLCRKGCLEHRQQHLWYLINARDVTIPALQLLVLMIFRPFMGSLVFTR